MSRSGVILTVVAVALLGLASWAGSTGFGLPNPDREPPSIREGSSRPAGMVGRPRYFAGGGIHSGK